MVAEKATLQARKKAEEEVELKRLEAEEENRQREEAVRLAARKPVGAAAALKKDDDNLSEIEKAGGRVKKKRGTGFRNNWCRRKNRCWFRSSGRRKFYYRCKC